MIWDGVGRSAYYVDAGAEHTGSNYDGILLESNIFLPDTEGDRLEKASV